MKIIFTMLLFLITLGWATDYYVATTGSDSNSGTITQPFQTINHAAETMVAGDVCYIRTGTYRETIVPKNDGTSGNPITFINFDNEKVVITGLDVLTDWSIDEGAIWKASLNDMATQVFINGALVDKARFPNAGYSKYDTDSWAQVNFTADRKGTMSGISSFGDLKGARVIGLTGHRWVAVAGTIASIAGESFSVNQTSHHWSSNNPSVYLGDGVGYLVNHKNLIDVPNEWFYENGQLYLIAPGNADPNTLAVEARVRSRGANLNDKQNIHLVGLHFKAANVTMRDAEGCLIDRCSIRYPVPFYDFANGFNRDDENPDEWDGNGVEVSGYENTIKNTYIAHSWGDGVTLWGGYNRLENCLIEDCNWMAIDSAPLCATGEGHVITNNTLRKAGRSILVHRHLSGAEITYNHLHDAGLMTDDLGLTYSYRTDGGGTVIAYNWVHDNNAKHTGPGIYLDNYDLNYVVHHNVVWNCGEGIRLNLPQTNTDVFNNTFWNNDRPMGEWGQPGTKMENCRMWNNIQNHPTFIGNDKQNNLYTTESMFVDAENSDFRLVEGTQAIDYGIEISGITDGFVGNAPDAGAYEFGDNWVAGTTIEPPSFEDSVPVAPTNLIARIKSRQVILTWQDNASNEHGFAIDRKFDIHAFEEIGRVGADIQTFVDTTAAPLTTYTYRIRAFNNAGSNLGLDFVTITTVGDGSAIRLEAEDYDKMSGINNNGDTIGGCDNGDYIMFESVDFGEGFDTFITRCAVPQEYAGQYVHLKLDKRSAKSFAKFKVQATGGWDDFAEQSMSIDNVTGVHDLYVVFSGGSGVGNFDWFHFLNQSTAVKKSPALPSAFNLLQNYPNPFNPTTTISYELPGTVHVQLRVFDLRGRLVDSLVNQIQQAGEYSIQFSNSGLPSGTYFYKFTAGAFTQTRKMMLIR